MKEKQQTQEALQKRIQELEAANALLVAEINQLKKAPGLGQSEKESGELEEKAQQLIRLAPAAIYEIDFFGQRFISVNDIACQWTGYERDELLLMNPMTLMDDEGRATLQNRIRRKLEGENVDESVEYKIKTKDGREIIVAANLGAMTYEAGRPKSALVVAYNITERKRAEEQIRYQAALLSNVNDAIVASDAEFRVTAWNAAAESLYGWKAEEVIGRNGPELVQTVWPDIEADEMRRTITEMGRWRGEATQVRKDGTRFPVEVSSIVLHDNCGKITGFVSVNRDITGRKQAEDALHRYELLSDHSRDMILFMRQEDGYILEANAAALQTYGYSREELLSLTIRDLRAPNTLSTTADQMAKANAEGNLFETIHQRKDGSTFPVEVSSQGADIDGVRTLISIIRDISERKHAKEQLEQSNQKMNEILASIQDDFYVLNRDWVFVYASRRFTSKVGKEPEDFIGRNIWEMFPKHVGTVFEKNLRAAMEKREVRRFEIGGKYTSAWYRMTAFPSAEGLTILGTDITERKRAEDQAQAMREMLETVVNYMPASVCLIRGSDLRLQLVNPAYQSIAPGKEMVGHTLDELWAETGQDFTDICLRVLETGEPYAVVDEPNLIRRQPDGPLEEAYFSWSLHRVRLSGDEGWGLLNTSWETTSRKRAEEALRESESHRLAAEATKAERDRLYNVLEKLPAYTVLLSPDYHVPFANRFFRERFGESHGTRCYEYLFHRTEPCEVCETFRVFKTNAPHRWDWMGPDGRNYDVYDFPFTDSDGSPLIFEMGIDVTEMKQAQAALQHMNETLEQRVEERTAELRESEERFSLAFRHSPVGVHIFRFSDGCSVDANDAFLSFIEYSRGELIGHSAAALNLFVDPDQREKWMQELIEHGAVRNVDVQIRGKSGRIVSVLFSLVKIELAGESMGLVMAIDITERKRAEQLLLAAHTEIVTERNRLRAVMDALPVGVAIIDEHGGNIQSNAAFEQIWGGPRPEVSGIADHEAFRAWWFDTGQPVQPTEWASAQVVERGEPVIGQLMKIKRFDGQYAYISNSCAPIFDKDGKIQGGAAAMMDITSEKMTEEALRVSEGKYRNLFENMTEEVQFWQLVRDEAGCIQTWRLVDANPPTLKSWGRATVAEIQGKTTDEIFGPGATEHYMPVVQKIITEGVSHSYDDYFPNLDKYFRFTSVPLGDYFITTGADITAIKKAEQALRNAFTALEQRMAELQTLMDVAPVAIAIGHDSQGKVITANRLLSEWLCAPNGTNVSLAMPKELRSIDYQVFRNGQPVCKEDLPVQYAALHAQKVKNDELTLTRSDGVTIEMLANAEPLFDADGRVRGSIAAYMDITERKRAENELRAARDELEERVRERTAELEQRNIELQVISGAEHEQRQLSEALVKAALILNNSLNQDAVLHHILEQIREVIPYQFASIALLDGETFYDASCQGTLDSSETQYGLKRRFRLKDFPVLKKMCQTGEPILTPDTSQDSDWVAADNLKWSRSFLAAPLLVEKRVIGFVQLFSAQSLFFTETMCGRLVAFAAHASVAIQNAWLFERVRAGSERLQSLSRRLVEIQESERLYIARELHDEAGQMLTSLIVHLRVLEKDANQPELVLKKVSEMEASLNDVFDSLHRIAMALRPATLDHLGLDAALHQYVESIREKHHLKVSFVSEKLQERLSANVETVLYRIVQEALTNVVRHAHATQVDVVLTVRDHKLILIIEDDGVGFDPDVVSDGGHLGLFGMRERIEMVDGKLIIESAPGKGTTVMVEVAI